VFITRRSLPRRTVLRGLGTAVALPFLESMVPAMTALAQTPARPPLRFGACYVPNGATMKHWMPDAAGPGFEYKTILKPLERWNELEGERVRAEDGLVEEVLDGVGRDLAARAAEAPVAAVRRPG